VVERASPPTNLAPKSSAGWALHRADGPGRGMESCIPRGRVVHATTTPPSKPNPNPSPQRGTETPAQPKVTATRKTARPEKPDHEPTAALKSGSGKPKKKVTASAKTAPGKNKTPSPVVPTQNPTSTLKEISDLHDHLPFEACVEMIRRLLTSISSLPTGAARSRAVLKTVFYFCSRI